MDDGLWVECILGWGLVWVCVRECGGKGTYIFRYLAQFSARKEYHLEASTSLPLKLRITLRVLLFAMT